MAYRRRDSGRAHSSADAYRTVSNPASKPSPASSSSHAPPSSSSEEETHLNARTESPSPYGDSVEVHDSKEALSPPRPFFLAGSRKSEGSDRGSWSSVNDSSEPASDSDKDLTDKEPARRARASTAGSATGVRPRNHHRRRSSSAARTADPFATPPVTGRAPPSAFPFLSHAGNPDPGTPIPGNMARRASHESFRRLSGGSYVPPTPGTPLTATGVAYPTSPHAQGGYNALRSERNSIDVADGYAYAPVGDEDLARPHAPFMHSQDGSDKGSWSPPLGAGGAVYRNSAAAAMSGSAAALGEQGASLPRTSSQPQIAMRAPFLSPASRPTSSLWSPPSYPSLPNFGGNQPLTSQYPPSLSYLPNSPYGSGVSPYHPKRGKAPMPSSRLPAKLSPEDKPWMKKKDSRERISWWLTLGMIFVGFGVSAIVLWRGWTGVRQLTDDQLCLVMNDNFNSFDENNWSRDVELGGFGNGEFQAATNEDKNLYVKNGQLYFMPTLTSDDVGGKDAVISGGSLSLDGCTAGTDSASSDGSKDKNCTIKSDGSTVLPPVKSARIHTKGKKTIKYGRVEVRAKLPRGDWLWPAIWMLPQENKYGPWPLSGEIDIMEARGNAPSYPAQGVNFVRSSLNYGPLAAVQTHILGWYQQKRFTYADDFHVYALEWSPSFIRTYIDTKLQATLTIPITGRGGKDFFTRGHYPATAHNGSDVEVTVNNIWQDAGGAPSAPFDQNFFLIINLAVGGTSGWFPDGVGDKPWFDTSGDKAAANAFAKAQDTWSKTWPSSENDRALRVDYVKMWEMKQGGRCPS